MKKFMLITFLLIFIFGGVIYFYSNKDLSTNELNKSKSNYQVAIQDLCHKYDISVENIKIEKHNRIDEYYIAYAYIYSDDFKNNLTSNEAFNFSKELNDLGDNIEDKNKDIILYIPKIVSKEKEYYYDKKNNLEYLMCEKEAVYTKKDNKVMYDIFNGN